ncbi:MAG TPA: hypothetical protein VNU49_03375 [Opitutaceae bacterium]|jgi:hypothetical protein|nr:hypothetical protein [Opitutaceae bacterium]
MNHRASALRRFLLLLWTLPSMAFAADWTINVNTVMSEAGKKLAHPTTDHPVYYYPYVVGYWDVGLPLPVNKPSEDYLDHLIAEALASQGYLVTHVDGTKLNPPPSLLLIFRWGNISPTSDRTQRKELRLVGATDSDMVQDTLDKIDLWGSADDNRYYVIIAACDFATFYTQHKMQLLWVSQMSIPRQELDMKDVVAPLIKTATPFLGRETTKPLMVEIVPPGNVKAGTPVLKGYITPSAAQPLTPPQP